MPYEGQTATGPNGEKAVFRNGQWYAVGGGTTAQIGGQDPAYDYKAPQADATLGKTKAEIQATLARIAADQRKTALDEQQFAAGLAKDGLISDGMGGFTINPNRPMPPPQITAEQRDQALLGWHGANKMEDTLKTVNKLYKRGPGATPPYIGAALDYSVLGIGLPQNTAFDKAANRLRPLLKPVLGLTGGENNSAAEMKMNMGAYIPQASDSDATNAQTLADLAGMPAQARQVAVARLGGIPDSAGRVTPLPRGYRVGQYPELDKAISAFIDQVPNEKRQEYLSNARRNYEAAKRGQPHPVRPRNSATRNAPRKQSNSGWTVERISD